MDAIQRKAIIRFFGERAIRQSFGYISSDKLTDEIIRQLENGTGSSKELDRPKLKAQIDGSLNGKAIGRDTEILIAPVLVNIAKRNLQKVTSSSKFHDSTKDYLNQIVFAEKKPNKPETPSSSQLALPVPTPYNGISKRLLQSGAYQIFRRYKPKRESNIHKKNNIEDPENHAVICEIAYLNVVKRTCVLVTSQRQVYRGTMATNHRRILSILLHREAKSGSHYRYVSVALHEEALEVYSGLMTKTGDTTKRPVASELLIKKIPRHQGHGELYKELRELYRGSGGLPANAKHIMKYLTDIPPNINMNQDNKSWANVRFVKDFALISQLSKTVNGVTLFREPSRTLSFDDLLDLSESNLLPVYKSS